MSQRPISILIAALGGEGGGVLSDWIVSAATAEGYPVQSTSVPGVAQRTGATTYYVEIFPVRRDALGGREPVLALTPSPGDVSLVAASELVEAGRMIQAGYVRPDMTTLVASTHREYAIAEKSAMSDARYPEARILEAARRLARQSLLHDFAALAARHGTVINTVLFGAMAGSGALPLSRDACEAAIRAAGKSVKASLQGFAAGYALATGHASASANAAVEATPEAGTHATSSDAASRSRSPAGKAAPAGLRARLDALPESLRAVAGHGVELTADYQDAAYAHLYLDRVENLRRAAADPRGEQAVTEAARYLALWMSYEDVIRVADLKTRASRLQRVRDTVGARPDEPVHVTEFLKPGLDEACSILPPRLAGWLRARLAAHADRLHRPLRLRTTTVSGFALLCMLRGLRRWRRRGSRYAQEQAAIERWLDAVAAALPAAPELAYELALCGNLVKGYGSTHARGHRNLGLILDAAGGADESATKAQRVKQAREAALADPEGRALSTALDLPPPPLVAKPVRFVRRGENLSA